MTKPENTNSDPGNKVIGVPYAHSVYLGAGQVSVTCPECGEEFIEETDEYGEETTTNYSTHSVKEHPQLATRVSDLKA